MMKNLKRYFSVPLRAMSSKKTSVFIPDHPDAVRNASIGEQFLEGAGEYHNKYTNTDYFKGHIINALQHISFAQADPSILDVGSGSGNSVIPCLEIFPESTVVATDLSPVLLQMLADQAENVSEWQGRLGCVCMDVSCDFFRPGAFDLVIGAAILHHLIDPRDLLGTVLHALRPGGVAIFFEPFENGNSILRLAYQEILSSPLASELDAKIENLLRALDRDFEVRTGADKSDIVYRQIDDKWLFTRHYFESVADALGYSSMYILPMHAMDRPFSRQTETNLRLGAGLEPQDMPPFAWDILARYDNFFSPELKHDLMIEGTVILRH